MSQLAVDGFPRRARSDPDRREEALPTRSGSLPSACAGWIDPRRDGAHGVHAARRRRPRVPARHDAQAPNASMEPAVAERRSGRSKPSIDEYETYSEQAADVFASVQAAPLSETMLPMGDLGTHPMSILPSTVPVRRLHAPAQRHPRAERLHRPPGTAARREAAAPDDRMDARRTPVDVRRRRSPAVVDRPLALILDGPGGGTWTIAARRRRRPGLVTEGAVGDAGGHGARAPTTTS